MKRITTTLALLAILLPGAALAAPTDEEKCQKALYDAAGKYAACMAKAFGAYSFDPASMGKCVDKYRQTWTKLVSKYAGKGTSCEGDRYADNGDGTFYDRLTRLTWETKTDDGSIHDKDNTYTWSTGSPWKEDGTAFTTFLDTLNGTGFAGSSGWRLPSIYELNTLVEPGYPNCTIAPCTTVPGQTVSSRYWSSSTNRYDPDYAWGVFFLYGVDVNPNKTSGFYVRAVRGGS